MLTTDKAHLFESIVNIKTRQKAVFSHLEQEEKEKMKIDRIIYWNILAPVFTSENISAKKEEDDWKSRPLLEDIEF